MAPPRTHRWFLTGALLFTFAPTLRAQTAAPTFLDTRRDIVLWSPDPIDPVRTRVVVEADGRSRPVECVTAIADAPDPDRVSLAGTFQESLGGSAWNPGDARTRMRPLGNDRHAWVARLPAGPFSFKVVRGGGWARNWGADFAEGGANLERTVPDGGAWVRFEVDFPARTIRTSVDADHPLPAPSGPLPPESGPVATRALRVRLSNPVEEIDLPRTWRLRVADGPWRPVHPRAVLDEPRFRPRFAGRLGARWSPAGTRFQCWSPVARSVRLVAMDPGAAPRIVSMRRGPGGVWSCALPGDRHGLRYRFRIDIRGVATDTADLWCTGATADSRWSVVLDPARTRPPGWAATPVPRLARPTDAVLYELHVRDFTIDPSSGVPPTQRGRAVGAVRRGAVGPRGKPAGIDHLLRLGATHVQVLPVQNFNPDHSRHYNWGYETTLFDVPEEQYATRPEDPATVVRDTKAMVQGFHRAGIGVVLDVVYNHTVPASGPASAFEATVPWYWFRTDLEGRILNESGVGNALADDRWMARRWMLESLAYWVREYRVDGFRFDLMGMFTPETVRAIESTLRRIRPDLLLHGEPWTGGGPVRFGIGAQRGTRVAVFNDRFRGTFRGALDGNGRGFATGAGDPAAVREALAGSPSIAADPLESLNYVSAHDNLTLRDKLGAVAPADPPDAARRAFRLATGAVLLSQGVPFLEGGAPEVRSRRGNFGWAATKQPRI